MNNEPVAYRWKWDAGLEWHYADYYTDRDYFKLEPLYTHPVELTDEEKWEIFTNLARSPDLRADMIRFADSILRKAQEK